MWIFFFTLDKFLRGNPVEMFLTIFQPTKLIEHGFTLIETEEKKSTSGYTPICSIGLFFTNTALVIEGNSCHTRG